MCVGGRGAEGGKETRTEADRMSEPRIGNGGHDATVKTKHSCKNVEIKNIKITMGESVSRLAC